MKFIFFKLVTVFIAVLGVSGFALAQTESQKGIDSYEKGNYSTAIEILEKVTQTDKKDGIAWRFLGMAYARTKDIKQARKAFGKAEDFKDKDLDRLYDTPLKIITNPFVRYTDEARSNSITGRIKVAVEFGANGQIRQVIAIRGLPYGLTENAVRAANGIKFEPAVRIDKPVTVIRFMEYSFDIY